MLELVLSVFCVIVVFGVIVFVHELGHFLSARYYDIAVEIFSIGFGPEIIGWTDSKKTRWRISLLPLGGYVMYLGDADAASATVSKDLKELDRGKALHYRGPLQRLVVNVCGPLANYLFAIIVFFSVFYIYGRPGASNEIESFSSDSVAKVAGVSIGDRIVSINGTKVESFSDLQKAMALLESSEVVVTVKKISGEESSFSFEAKPSRGSYILGVKTSNGVTESFISSLKEAVLFPFQLSYDTLKSLTYMIVNGKADGLGGPVAIVKGISSAANEGMMHLLFYVGLLSTSLGFFNLLPIPTLDGGHILFCLIEIIRGRPVSEKMQEWFFMVGFGFLVLLFLFVTYKDILLK
jgi:regulator of sigma E protease